MSRDDWGPTDADFEMDELRETARLNRMKEGARAPGALPAVRMFPDIEAPGEPPPVVEGQRRNQGRLEL